MSQSKSTTLMIYHVAKLIRGKAYDSWSVECVTFSYVSDPQITVKDPSSKTQLDTIIKEFKWVETEKYGVLPSLMVLSCDMTIQPGQLYKIPDSIEYEARSLLLDHYYDFDIKDGLMYLGKLASSKEKADEIRRYYKERKELFDPLILTLGQSKESVTGLYPTDEMIQMKLVETLEQERKAAIEKEKRTKIEKEESVIDERISIIEDIAKLEPELTELKARLTKLETKA